jgi:hypothetical protein
LGIGRRISFRLDQGRRFDHELKQSGACHKLLVPKPSDSSLAREGFAPDIRFGRGLPNARLIMAVQRRSCQRSRIN